MQTSVSRNESRTTRDHGIVYLTVCQNPGCGFKFDLKITPANASFLSGSASCPPCLSKRAVKMQTHHHMFNLVDRLVARAGQGQFYASVLRLAFWGVVRGHWVCFTETLR
jgi:hypothetical protein